MKGSTAIGKGNHVITGNRHSDYKGESMNQQLLLELGKTCIATIIRIITKGKASYITDGALDFVELGNTICKNVLEISSLNHNIDEFVISFAETLESSNFFEGIEEERKEVIIQKVIDDISKRLRVNEGTIEKIMAGEDLIEMIDPKNDSGLSLWSDKEIGAYNNCLRYSVDAITRFIEKMPDFGEKALKVLYQRDAEAFKQINEYLRKIINLLDSQKNIDRRYRDYESDYRRKITSYYKNIYIFGSGLSNRTVKKYDVSTSYVELFCSNVKDESNNEPIEISSVFDSSNYVWLSGEAGGGKTTFIQWLAVNAANQSMDYLKGYIPIVVSLRKLDRFPIVLHTVIEELMGRACPDGWLDHLFKNNKALLLFDGVDELSKNQREEFYDFVELTVSEWENNKTTQNRILITSRPYIDDKLRFDYSNYKMLRMNSKQIEKFIYYWHKTIITQEDEGDKEPQKTAEDLIKTLNTTPAIKGIASTPLLCAMICAVNYCNNGYLPADRNELYDKCCHMFIDARDKERDINTKDYKSCNNLNYKKKELLLRRIARKMLVDEKVEIKSDELVAYLKEYLNDISIGDDDLKDDPEIIVDYFVQRSGILIEPISGKIDFVHKTFLEYLAGLELASNAESYEIIDNAINPFWKEAIIMSFNHLSQEKSTEFLARFINMYYEEKSDEYIFMAALCMENSNAVRDDIKNDICSTIQQLIPPSIENIPNLCSCSEYIMPFLKNKNEYTSAERNRCIRLLRNIIYINESLPSNTLEETVNTIMTYFHRGTLFMDKCRIAKSISESIESIDEQYTIRKEFFDVINNELINDKKLKVSVDMLNIIDLGIIKNVSFFPVDEMTLVNAFHTSSFEFIDSLDEKAQEWLSDIKTLTIQSSYVGTYDILDYMYEITKLSIYTNAYRDEILDYIRNKKCCENVISLEYISESVKSIYTSDLVHFKNLVTLSLELDNKYLEFEIDDWCTWKYLNEVRITVDWIVYNELAERVAAWEKDYPSIEFIVDFFEADGD